MLFKLLKKLIYYSQVLTMTDKTTLCPLCGQGILDSEEIKDFPKGEHIETRYYSCGHKHVYIETSEGVVVKDVLGKIVLFGGDKIGKKKYEYEIEKRYRNNDIDRLEAPTVEFICINHRANPTSVFHIVKYIEPNELKHIDCKICDNKWQHNSGTSLESHFEVKHNPEADSLHSLKIECLKCNAKYERFS